MQYKGKCTFANADILLDTGASEKLICEDCAKQSNIRIGSEAGVQVTLPSGHSSPVAGKCKVYVGVQAYHCLVMCNATG